MKADTSVLLLLAPGGCGEEDRSFTDLTPASGQSRTSADDPRPRVVVYGQGGRLQTCGALPSRAPVAATSDTLRS